LVKKQVFTDPSRDQIDALINLYYSGQAIQVIHTCKKLLKIHKKSLVLLNLLGASSQAIGKYEEAINSYNRAIRVSPNDSGLRYNIALAFQNIGRPDSAIKNYNKAIQIKPDYAEAYNNLGSVLAEMMQPNEAIKNYNKAIQIQPDYAEAYNNLGNILKDLVKPNEAIKNYNKAIQLKPDYAEAYNDLGVALQELGRLDEAIKNYKKAIQLKPDYAEAYSNFGTALQELGRSNEAIKSHNKAIQLDPNDSSAYSNLGVALKDLGQLDEAINNYNKAIKLKPDYEIAYNNLGVTLRELGRLDEAVKNYSKAIQLKPSYTEAYSNLLMDLNYATSTTPTQAITTARKFGEFVTENTQMRFSNYQNLSASKKLRVGFVSGDLRRHPVGYFLENVLSHINPDRIELVAYSASSIIDDLSKRITPLFSTWKSIYGQNNEVVAKTIHSDKIHILIDLSGHTAYNRLPVFGWRPAPIQVSWLGYFATTGLNEMDYLLGDPYVTPAEYDSHFTEKVWRLTKTRWCFTPPNVNINVAELPALNNGYITFGCFNNLSKMNHKVVELWSKVLKSTPNSRLLLKAKQLRDKSTQENVIQKFGIQGIKSERIILEGPEKREKYFSAYNRIDIALDPFPFTGGTTSVECLWMGVPVLTLAGDSLISRQGVGILMNIGLPNWIAENESEYITKSIFFASDLEKLVELRAGLRMQALTSPLFDAQNFAQDFENALWGMWEKYLHQSQIK
jgi:predicted O-linked N-acetylglucosamine transferase (SPINDLY family)